MCSKFSSQNTTLKTTISVLSKTRKPSLVPMAICEWRHNAKITLKQLEGKHHSNKKTVHIFEINAPTWSRFFSTHLSRKSGWKICALNSIEVEKNSVHRFFNQTSVTGYVLWPRKFLTVVIFSNIFNRKLLELTFSQKWRHRGLVYRIVLVQWAKTDDIELFSFTYEQMWHAWMAFFIL